MKKLQMSLLCVVPLVGLAFGCVAIPVGKETYTAEFRGDIRAAVEGAAKTREPFVAHGTVPGETFSIGLTGKITTSQPQVQHYKQVTVAKQKVIGVGICPQMAPGFFHPKRALDRTTSYYKGSNADYSDNAAGPGSGVMSFGRFLNGITLGTASMPFTLLYGIFGPFEQDWHYLGEVVQTNYAYAGRTTYITRIRDYGKIDLLAHFSPADRKKMGLWTWKDNAEHPQNTFWHGFSSCSLAGICKYCDYVIRDPVETEKTTPAPPRITTQTREVKGPYAVTLDLPEIGYRDTVDVAPGETMAAFPAMSILALANGRTDVDGRVLFRPPPGGWDEIGNEDDRALLKAAMGRTWDVHFTLPAPASKKPAPAPQSAEPAPVAPEREPVPAPVVEERPLYSITAIEPSPDGILVVRVHVEDTSRTFDIDRLVRPEVVRLFREQFATGANAERREAVRWMTEDEGRTLVYCVGFSKER